MRINWVKSCILLAVSSAIFLPSPKASSDQTDPAIQAALAETVRAYEQAVSSGDFEGVGQYLSPGFSVVTFTGEEVSSTKGLSDLSRGIRDQFGKGSSHNSKAVPTLVQQLSPENVLVFGLTNDTVTNSAGEELSFQTKWTAFAVKMQDSWRVQRVHVSMDPRDNVFVQLSSRGLKITYGLLAGLVGLLFGAIFAAMLIGFRGSSKAV
jgi:ketosteroid isomerase-like protein